MMKFPQKIAVVLGILFPLGAAQGDASFPKPSTDFAIQPVYAMAIELNVTAKEQEALHDALEIDGYKHPRQKFHCTIGFIEKMIPQEEVTAFGEAITQALQEHIDREPLVYEVDKAAYLFKDVLAFLPTARSKESLKNLNLWLSHKIQEISKGRWKLNRESTPEHYFPHLTLWHTHSPDSRLKKLEELAATHPTFLLRNAAYVIVIQ